MGSGLALDLDGAEGLDVEEVFDLAVSVGADDDGGGLGGALDAGGGIDRVADCQVLDMAARAHVTDYDQPGVQADADL